MTRGGGGGGEDNRNGEIIIAGRTDMGIVGSDTERKKHKNLRGYYLLCVTMATGDHWSHRAKTSKTHHKIK